MKNVKQKLEFEAALARAGKKRTVEDALAEMQAWFNVASKDQRRKVTAELMEEAKTLDATGHSVAEIAEQVGLSVPTVRRVLSRKGRYSV